MSEKSPKSEAISARLRLAREQAGLSQGQVALKLNLHRPSISEIEAGRRKVSADELGAFAEIYGVDVSWLACADQGTSDLDQDRIQQDRIQLAARELAKLTPEDLSRLLQLLSALKKREDVLQ